MKEIKFGRTKLGVKKISKDAVVIEDAPMDVSKAIARLLASGHNPKKEDTPEKQEEYLKEIQLLETNLGRSLTLTEVFMSLKVLRDGLCWLVVTDGRIEAIEKV